MDEPDGAGLRFDAEERLPWLEPIEDREEPGMAGRLTGLVVAGLLVIGLIVGDLWWWQSHSNAGRGQLIASPSDPYKVPAPPEKGRFDGEGAAAVAAAEGVATPSRVDASRMPEQPVPPIALPPQRRHPPIPPTILTPPAGSPQVPATSPAATANGGSSVVQIAAFSSEAAAAHAWDGLKARFAWLASVNRSIVPAQVNGRTVYRLQAQAASSTAATALCGRLRVAGENCLIPR